MREHVGTGFIIRVKHTTVRNVILFTTRDERTFEYIRIFEYFPSNINHSNMNIQILSDEYIRIFEIFPPNIYEYFGIKNLIY